MVWRCKDIKLSGTLQDEQVGVLIIKLKGSTLAKLRNHDPVKTPAQDSLNSFIGAPPFLTGVGTLTPVINQLKLDIAWKEMLTSCHKQTVFGLLV